jgi:putative transposase
VDERELLAFMNDQRVAEIHQYMRPSSGAGTRRRSQGWTTFVRNHARAVLACDFFVAVTVRFRLLYGFVVMDVGTRRIVHWNVTEHPTAEWTQQQFRMVAAGDQPHQFLIHDACCAGRR